MISNSMFDDLLEIIAMMKNKVYIILRKSTTEEKFTKISQILDALGFGVENHPLGIYTLQILTDDEDDSILFLFSIYNLKNYMILVKNVEDVKTFKKLLRKSADIEIEFVNNEENDEFADNTDAFRFFIQRIFNYNGNIKEIQCNYLNIIGNYLIIYYSYGNDSHFVILDLENMVVHTYNEEMMREFEDYIGERIRDLEEEEKIRRFEGFLEYLTIFNIWSNKA